MLNETEQAVTLGSQLVTGEFLPADIRVGQHRIRGGLSVFIAQGRGGNLVPKRSAVLAQAKQFTQNRLTFGKSIPQSVQAGLVRCRGG